MFFNAGAQSHANRPLGFSLCRPDDFAIGSAEIRSRISFPFEMTVTFGIEVERGIVEGKISLRHVAEECQEEKYHCETSRSRSEKLFLLYANIENFLCAEFVLK